MFCQYCGTQVPDGNTNCTNCGAALTAGTTNAQSANTNYQAYNQAYSQPVNQMNYGYAQPMTQAKPKNAVNIFAIIATAVLFLSLLLPYVNVFGKGIALIEEGSDRFFFLGVIAIAVLGIAVKKNVIIIIAGVIACFLTFIESTNFDKYNFFGLVKTGIGFYVMIAGAVMLLISGFIKRKK